jgi:hypothetical protein
MNLYNLIFEKKEEDTEPEKGEGVKVGKKTRLAKDSLDDQIDSLLIKYEMESIIDDEGHSDFINESMYDRFMKGLLKEQEDPKEGEVLDPAAKAAGKTKGSERQEEDDEGEERTPNIDIDVFTKKVARLILNADNLLNVEQAILNRAEKFIRTNYNDEHIDRFKTILEKQFDIESDLIFRDFTDSPTEHDAPQGFGAFAGGTGGGA